MDKELEEIIMSLDDNAKIVLRASIRVMMSRLKEIEDYYIEVYNKLGDEKVEKD